MAETLKPRDEFPANSCSFFAKTKETKHMFMMLPMAEMILQGRIINLLPIDGKKRAKKTLMTYIFLLLLLTTQQHTLTPV
jgi:hypothetical protein